MTATRTNASRRYRCPTCGGVWGSPADLHCPRCDSPAHSLSEDRVLVAGPSRDRLFDLFSPVEWEMYSAIGGAIPTKRRDWEARSAA